jgi:hypothetical protein
MLERAKNWKKEQTIWKILYGYTETWAEDEMNKKTKISGQKSFKLNLYH